jgi:hypothetical protein
LTTEQLGEWRKENSQDPSPHLLTEEEKQKLARIEENTSFWNSQLRLTVAKERLVSVKLPDEYAGADPFEGGLEDEILNARLELLAQEIENKAEEGWLLPEAIKKSLGSPSSLEQPEGGVTTTTNAADAKSETSTSFVGAS